VCGLDSPWPRGRLLCLRQWTFWFRKRRQFSRPANPTVGFSHGVGVVLPDVVVLARMCEWKNRHLCVLITIVRRSLLFLGLSSCDLIFWPLSNKTAVRWKRLHSFVVWRDTRQWMSGTRLWICLWTWVNKVLYLNCCELNVIFGSWGMDCTWYPGYISYKWSANFVVLSIHEWQNTRSKIPLFNLKIGGCSVYSYLQI
jgi:hypothetical protein